MRLKSKSLKEESDKTLFEIIMNLRSFGSMSWKEMATTIFFIAWYYSELARPFFFIIFSLFCIGLIFIPSRLWDYVNAIENELNKRGYQF